MSSNGADARREPVDEEALDWALRMTDPEADWDAFTTWLEREPSRSSRYDRAVVALEAATQDVRGLAVAHRFREADPPLNARPRSNRAFHGRRGWFGGAVAAALVGAIGVGMWHERDQGYEIATAPGERRDVRLADGGSISLAGGSRIRLDAGRPRFAVVKAGQALFRIRHDAANPYRVQVGDLALSDIGTVFDVSILGPHTRVAVAEGAVLVDPEGANVRLDPGQSITAEGGTLRRGRLDAADVGQWREGRLTYDDATMSQVAADLSRQIGVRVTASPAVAARTFNGTLETTAFRQDPAVLGELLGLHVRRDQGGLTLEDRR